jgi:hydrogenase-4 component E
MIQFVDPILVVVVLLNFLVLGASHIRTIISTVAAQGILLGVAMVLVHSEPSVRLMLLAGASIVLKGAVFPRMLLHAMREVSIRREVQPHVGFIASLLLGAVGTGLAVVFSRTLPITEEHAATLLVPASLSTVLVGFLVMSTRLKAITQVLGFLVLENGIFIFGLLLLEAMPFLVEVGVLLDLFVAIFVMGIIIHRISREFASVSTQGLTMLKD